MEKDGEKSALRPPPPPPPRPPPDYISGQGFGIRQLNAIRRNLVSPPGVPVGRFSTYEPIPLPIGLEHLNHVPPPKLVNGGKGRHVLIYTNEKNEKYKPKISNETMSVYGSLIRTGERGTNFRERLVRRTKSFIYFSILKK